MREDAIECRAMVFPRRCTDLLSCPMERGIEAREAELRRGAQVALDYWPCRSRLDRYRNRIVAFRWNRVLWSERTVDEMISSSARGPGAIGRAGVHGARSP